MHIFISLHLCIQGLIHEYYIYICAHQFLNVILMADVSSVYMLTVVQWVHILCMKLNYFIDGWIYNQYLPVDVDG